MKVQLQKEEENLGFASKIIHYIVFQDLMEAI